MAMISHSHNEEPVRSRVCGNSMLVAGAPYLLVLHTGDGFPCMP